MVSSVFLIRPLQDILRRNRRLFQASGSGGGGRERRNILGLFLPLPLPEPSGIPAGREHLPLSILSNILSLFYAKNTVPAHNTRNSRFEGDYYLAKQYGAITALIYEAFRQPTQAQLESMLIELAEKKYEMLQQISA